MSSALPGPRTPALYQMIHWIVRPIPFMEECARRYGDWFTLCLPRRFKFVFTSDPEAIREVFAGDAERLHAGEANIVLKPLLGENSLLLLDGARHFQERKLMMPPFHGERMQAYGTTMREITDHAVESWPVGTAFPIHPKMQSITLDVIMQTLFGISEKHALGRLRQHLVYILSITSRPWHLIMVTAGGGVRFATLQSKLGSLSPWGRISGVLGEVNAILFSEISKRRAAAAGDGQDVLTLLVHARDENGSRLSDRELRDEMMTLLVAGHETTATSLSWVFYRLFSHPEVLCRVLSELDEVVRNGPVLPEHINQLHYLDAAIKETLRLNPIVPIVGRYLIAPTQFAGRKLPAGVIVAPCIYLTHRRPDLWSEPERFNPERFLHQRVAPHQFFPFGGGMRRCLGMAFALYEMKVVVAQVLKRVVLRLAPGYTAKVVRRSITFAPSEGMPVVVDERGC